QLEPRHGLVGTSDLQLAVFYDDIAFVRFHQMRGNFLCLRLYLVERLHHGRHADGAGARAIRAHAHLHLVGVAVPDGNGIERHAQTSRYELGEGGFVALAVAVRPREDLDRSYRIDAHFSRFPKADASTKRANRGRRCNTASLDVAAHADATQL